MIWFNRSIQLKPEQLTAARQLWKEKGPKSYNLVYTKELGIHGKKDRFAVQVRQGKVEVVKMNDQPLEVTLENGEERDPRIYHSMDNLLRDMERFMDLDQKNANKVYVVGIFDEKTGAALSYTRYDMRTQERVELKISLERVAD